MASDKRLVGQWFAFMALKDVGDDVIENAWFNKDGCRYFSLI